MLFPMPFVVVLHIQYIFRPKHDMLCCCKWEQNSDVNNRVINSHQLLHRNIRIHAKVVGFVTYTYKVDFDGLNLLGGNTDIGMLIKVAFSERNGQSQRKL